jgi:hypothetical protein
MSIVAIVGLILIVIVFLLNVVATLMLARSDFETLKQKLLQLTIVWLLPCIGSIVIIAVSSRASAERETYVASGSSADACPFSALPIQEAFGAHDAGPSGRVGDAGGGH